VSIRTTLTMSNGLGIDLLNPKVSDINFLVIAEHLAKDNRYCGATRGLVYSVAEHSVRCADAALQATGDRVLAAYLLCHDMHEAFLGDDTTPKKQAIGAVAEQNFGALAEHIVKAFDLLVYRFDVVIHEAAGLSWPPRTDLQAAIKRWDRVLLATEWRFLMRCNAPYDFGVEPLPEPIDPLDWDDAAHQFYTWCEDLLPGLAVHQELMRRRARS
jgi:hypothetical protein